MKYMIGVRRESHVEIRQHYQLSFRFFMVFFYSKNFQVVMTRHTRT